MKEQPFFSIVMPVYGVEAYIEHAILSIMKQTYQDWEIVVVNDCSPDASVKIAEQMAGKDNRIRIIHHEKNQGLSADRKSVV